jgi:predicted secreted hydrolase
VPNLELDYVPRVKNQELDTTTSTGVIYWEGDSAINGTSNGKPIAGDGYVELTGFTKK